MTADPARQDTPTQESLARLIGAAERIAGIRGCTGLNVPRVIP